MVLAVIIMFLLLIPRSIIDILGYNTVPINMVVGAFISGVIFTLAIIFTGTFTDFKEREKAGGELAAALKPCTMTAVSSPSRMKPRPGFSGPMSVISSGS